MPLGVFSGISPSTEWDFVEVPSQMYEEWAWDADVLSTFATHHETGEPIPPALVRTMRAAEKFGPHVRIEARIRAIHRRGNPSEPRS